MVRLRLYLRNNWLFLGLQQLLQGGCMSLLVYFVLVRVWLFVLPQVEQCAAFRRCLLVQRLEGRVLLGDHHRCHQLCLHRGSLLLVQCRLRPERLRLLDLNGLLCAHICRWHAFLLPL